MVFNSGSYWDSIGSTLWLFNIAMEAMARRNRWFSQLEPSICKGFSMAMLNNQMVAGWCWLHQLATQQTQQLSVPQKWTSDRSEALSSWSEGHVWVSPEMHGTITGVFKNQIDWLLGASTLGIFGGFSPWRLGAIHPIAGWWFGTLFTFPYVGNDHPNWLIFFRRVGILT